jgi:amino acid adenylation domain-containing protein
MPIPRNDTAVGYPDTCIHDLFDAQANETPSAPALLFDPPQSSSSAGRHRLSYQNLNRRANQLARHLRALGVTRETLVGVCLDRSADMTVALLGILKAGGAYLPLDPGYPEARLAFMLEDSRAPVVVTHERWAGRLLTTAQVVCLDRDRGVLDELGADSVPSITTPDDPACVIYTSGTTGQPKGVVGLHRGAVNRLAWMWRAYPFGQDEVCCQKTSLNFVDSVAEIFAPLLQGIPTVIVEDDAVRDPQTFVEILATTGVTRLVLVPSLLRDILSVADVRDRLSGLKVCVSSGETLPVGLCRRFYELLPHAVLLNLYGSTEVSADVTCYDTRLLPPDAATVPLGRPIDNTQIYIVDETLQPVPAGASGELCVGGDGLARGYLNRPDLTSQRWVRNPFGAPSARMYRTGDRARYLPDGTIEFLGRLDHQVKIRGARVEPGEVEAVLTAHPGVAQAVVIARDDAAGDARLVAYVVPGDASMRVGELRRFCGERLPDHMVPSIFVPMDALPLTPSGKIDRSALPAPERPRPDSADTGLSGPRTSVEALLAGIWKETLGIDDVGVTDDFFDLGGDSLLAMRMIAQVGERYGRRLPVSVLARASTIERLADVLVHPETPQPWSPLIDLQPRGLRRPFFLVHGIGGEVLTFAGLASRLAPDQPVYGIRAKGSDGVHEPLADVESMAACYVEAVRNAAPEGPYLLGGYCSGGTVALEMARQLRQSGEEVALLALIDTEAPEPIETADRWSPRALGAYLRNLASWVVDDDFFRSTTAEKMERLRSKGRLLWSRIRSFEQPDAAGPDIRDVLGVWRFPDHHRAFLETHSRALANYRPQEYDGPITLIRARTVSLASLPPHDLGWSRFARGPLDVRVVPGAHDNILTEPRVQMLAAQLRACLDSAHAVQVRR